MSLLKKEMETFPVALTKDLVIQEAGEELLVYQLKNNKAFSLNETSAVVWQLCDGKRSILDIQNELLQNSKSNVSLDLIWLTLFQLQREELIEDNKNVKEFFRNNSRRQVIKRVGFASLVALPVVASIVAPSATMAQSGVMTCINPNLVSCVTPQDCINSGNGSDNCINNCCVFGAGIPGGGSIPGGGGINP